MESWAGELQNSGVEPLYHTDLCISRAGLGFIALISQKEKNPSLKKNSKVILQEKLQSCRRAQAESENRTALLPPCLRPPPPVLGDRHGC